MNNDDVEELAGSLWAQVERLVDTAVVGLPAEAQGEVWRRIEDEAGAAAMSAEDIAEGALDDEGADEED